MTVLCDVRIFDGNGNLKHIVTKEELLVRNKAIMDDTLDCDRIRLDLGRKRSADVTKCQVCGKEIEQKRWGKKYCSKKCNYTASGKKLTFNRQASATYQEKK